MVRSFLVWWAGAVSGTLDLRHWRGSALEQQQRKFTKKFIAFADIIGFKGLVQAAEDGDGWSVDELVRVCGKLCGANNRADILKSGPIVCPNSQHLRRVSSTLSRTAIRRL